MGPFVINIKDLMRRRRIRYLDHGGGFGGG
jgi:hypothetical protein